MPTRALLVLVSCVLVAGVATACGSAEESSGAAAEQLLRETSDATSSDLRNGRLNASLRIEPKGLVALGGPLTFTMAGPFAAAESTGRPRYAMRVGASVGGHAFRGRILSTGRHGYITVRGRTYRLDAIVKALRAGSGGVLRSLGLDPVSWVANPRIEGTEQVAGVETTRIVGELDAAKLLADLAGLLERNGAGWLLTPALRQRLVDAVQSSRVEVWTGSADRILRQLVMSLDFEFQTGKSPLPGLRGGAIALRVLLDDVNATTFSTKAPKGARDLRLPRLGNLSALLAAATK